jgi:hypothetical protein
MMKMVNWNSMRLRSFNVDRFQIHSSKGLKMYTGTIEITKYVKGIQTRSLIINHGGYYELTHNVGGLPIIGSTV